MELISRIDCHAELGAVVIRADGSREDRGVISRLRIDTWWRKLSWILHTAHWWQVALAVIALALLGWLLATQFHWLLAAGVFGIVTTAGVNYMASDFASGGVTPTISGFKFHDSGTGVTAAAVGDTALQTPAGPARVSGTPSNPTANQYRSVATIAYTATLAITEWGLFSAAAAGTLLDRRVFAAINVVSGDSIQFTYTLTVNSGGT